MSIELKPITRDDVETVWKMQVEAFSDLLDKYQDYDMSPAAEDMDKVLARFEQPWTTYFFIMVKGEKIRVVRVVDKKDGSIRVIVMNSKWQAGIKKKSFELNYNGGQIWCEHLDGMGTYEDEVVKKFNEDVRSFIRPSVSSFMIINLDETVVTERIAETIISNILETKKLIRKIAFVGVDKRWQGKFGSVWKKGIVVTFLDDYEKAKEWLLVF